MFRWHVVDAVFWRNVKQYFSGPLGYLFIVVFVTVSAVMAFSPQFFADNLANLDQLSRWFPMLLLFFVPAITMSVWADEKRQGTDSILFTLPASDFDILLGKYLAVAAVYTVALLFSMTQLIVLAIIGVPDWGVVFSTYVGYWLAGLALLSIGMFASSLTGSATVAFVLGAVFCAIPVLIGQYFRGLVGLERLGIEWNLREFTIGLIPLANVVYFVALTVFMLYLNLIVISRRHWHRGQQLSLGTQFLIRAVSLAVALIGFGYLCNTAVSGLWTRADLTAERLYSLDVATLNTLKKIKDNDQAVTIQAYVSRDVPRKYVNTKKQFVGLLRQLGESAGSNINVRVVDVLPNSDSAIEAERAGIVSVNDRSEIGGRMIEQPVFLGALISTALDDVTLPFISNDTAIEYELSRALATTIDKKSKITLGILDTDTFFGGPEYEGRRMPWAYQNSLAELKKNFKIKHLAASDLDQYLSADGDADATDSTDKTNNAEAKPSDPSAKPSDQPKSLDVLLVADPSSLDDVGAEALVKYIEAGHPTVILADPLPFHWTYQSPTQIGVLNAPRQPRVPMQSPYAQVLSSSPLPKSDGGSASKILKCLGVEWDNGATVWSLDNPHDNFKGSWPEYLGDRWPEYYGPRDKALVFVRDRTNSPAFNAADSISAGLKELLFFYPGSIRKSVDSKLDFLPLVTLGADSGMTKWESLTQTPKQEIRRLNPRTGELTVESTAARSQFTGEDLVVLNPDPRTGLDEEEHVIAARISGSGEKAIHVVFIADLDFVSDLNEAFETVLEQKVDNLALLQNVIEVLSGNDVFVTLRNRRSKPRSLVKLESVFEKYRAEAAKKKEEAETSMQKELKLEQDTLDKATDKIRADDSLNILQKLQRSSQEATDAQRRFELRQRKLERELSQTINELETRKQNQISAVQNWTRYTSILTAPLPALLLGIFVLWYRYSNEQKNIAPERKV